jgi:uncharacterized protein (TIGR03437 family)
VGYLRHLGCLAMAVCCAVSLEGQMSQPKRVLYVTTSAGFRHDSIAASVEAMRGLDPERLAVTATEDTSAISVEGLRGYDAVFFFTSGELPLNDAQKTALLDFVRGGKGFGGAHSATDTLYTWPEYAGLIGATFDGHPWVSKVRLDAEDPANPVLAGLESGMEIEEEIYQFRNFSRDRVRVLLSLDTSTVDRNAPGINRTDGDFASAWMQRYGQGRVFYTALGHFDATWRDPRFQRMLRNGLLWMTGVMEADAAPRPAVKPAIAADAEGPAVGNAATLRPRALSPGVLFSLFGSGLTPGSPAGSSTDAPPRKLAGATVLVNGEPVPLLWASAGQVNAMAPARLPVGEARVQVAAGGVTSEAVVVPVREQTPAILAVTREGAMVTVWAIGLGESGIWPDIRANGSTVTVLSRALVSPGLYQAKFALPEVPAGPLAVEFN